MRFFTLPTLTFYSAVCLALVACGGSSNDHPITRADASAGGSAGGDFSAMGGNGGTDTGTGGAVTANTINAASCSYADVSAAINSAVDGDAVLVPAGSCTWNSQLVVTKGITLQGAGIDQTVLVNNVPASRIHDYLIRFSPGVPADNPSFILTGFTFDANQQGGSVSVMCTDDTYPCTNFRIHNNKLENAAGDGYSSSGLAIRTKGNTFGLIDNNQFVDNAQDFKIYGNDKNSWDNYPGLANTGTANYLYIENNTRTGNTRTVLSSGEGARWVYRYNSGDITTVSLIWDAHGNTHNHGVVAHEIYENTFTSNGDPITQEFKTLDYRGGTGMIYNNSVQAGTSGVRTFINVREEESGCGEPVSNGYIWNNRNTRNNKVLAIWESDPYNCIAEDTNWWDDAASVPGGESPSNFTYDSASNRPSTCSDNDSYWETDTKKLYRCEGDNNWIFIYKPYTYPHPLASGTSA